MKLRTTTLILLFAAFISAACSQSKSQNPRTLSEEDQRIENILVRTAFEDLDGNEVYLSDYKGKVVLVDFWETWCGPCLQVFPAMDSLKAQYPDDFEVLTVNLLGADTKEDVAQFAAEYGYDFTYGMDVNSVGEQVITLGIPFKVFFDPDGFLIKSELGSAGTAGDYEKAKVIIDDNKQTEE